MTDVLVKRGNEDTHIHTHTGRTPRTGGGRDLGGFYKPGNFQNLGDRHQKDPPLRTLKMNSPC